MEPGSIEDGARAAPTRTDVDAVLRSLVRARAILLAIAILVPAGCHALFERQARRLDAVADHGVIAQATVTAQTEQGGARFTRYVVDVEGVRYEGSVERADAPYDVGASFPMVLSAEDPTLALPGADRSRAAARAAENRAFAWKLEAGVFVFFGANALFSHLRLGRLQRTRLTEVDDPVAYRRRLVFAGALLAPMVVGISAWHARDAMAQGESVWPVALAGLLSVAIVVGTAAYVLREGRAHASARSARRLLWAAPLAVGIALVRLLAWLVMGRR